MTRVHRDWHEWRERRLYEATNASIIHFIVNYSCFHLFNRKWRTETAFSKYSIITNKELSNYNKYSWHISKFIWEFVVADDVNMIIDHNRTETCCIFLSQWKLIKYIEKSMVIIRYVLSKHSAIHLLCRHIPYMLENSKILLFISFHIHSYCWSIIVLRGPWIITEQSFKTTKNDK